MSNNEAKFVLGAYRPNGRDAGDATFCAALEQAKTDPALGAWLARSQAHDAAITARLREVAPPAGLREAILAGARASRAPKTARFPTMWLALAASVAVLLAGTFAFRANRAAAATTRFAEFAMDDAEHGKHGGHGEPVGALQVMLSQPSTRVGAALPVDFAALRSTGCRTLNFAGHDVLEVCFQRNGAWFHCYIARCEDFPSLPTSAPAVFKQLAQLGCASWSDATYHYTLVSESGVGGIKQLL